MLKFDNFQTSPIVEGFDEYINKVSNANKLYSNDDTTYLNAYSELLANEKMLSQLSTGLIEKMDAQKYCNIIKKIKKDGPEKNDVTYRIQNNYLTDNIITAINANNKDSYINGKCATVKNWAMNKVDLRPIDVNAISSASISQADIYNNFGQSIVSDLSYISLLINRSNAIINSISSAYPKNLDADLFQTSLNKYNTNVKMRKKLDDNMIELYKGDQSIGMYQKKTMDSVVYANVLWTILATSLIYFVFIKI